MEMNNLFLPTLICYKSIFHILRLNRQDTIDRSLLSTVLSNPHNNPIRYFSFKYLTRVRDIGFTNKNLQDRTVSAYKPFDQGLAHVPAADNTDYFHIPLTFTSILIATPLKIALPMRTMVEPSSMAIL